MSIRGIDGAGVFFWGPLCAIAFWVVIFHIGR